MSAQRTALYEDHQALGGRLVEFAGWELPVQYAGILSEHKAVREAVGIFDVSHMGEILVSGSRAGEALQYLTCNNIAKIAPGAGQYNALTNETGGVVDDIIVYRLAEERFLLCVNASNTVKDFTWINQHNRLPVQIENASSAFGQIAVQGPRALELTVDLFGAACAKCSRFNLLQLKFAGADVILARTGYTGEDGFEMFVPWDKTRELWAALLDAGKRYGVQPCGLGARDLLRLEACLSLYGHELGDDISALESGLGWIVKFDKGDFIGRAALQTEKINGSKRQLIGFYLDEPGIGRQGDKILDSKDAEIGFVTSGTKSPSLDQALGLGLVASSSAALDAQIQVEVRGRRLRGHIVPRPFYRR